MLEDTDEVIAALTRRILASPAPDANAEAAMLQAGKLELIEALARVFESQQRGAHVACLGPLLPGATLVGGARVPGTSLELEPSHAAYCVAWLSGSAPLGGLLPLADYLARRAVLTGVRPLRVAALMQACAQAHELAACITLPAPHDAPALAAPLAMRVALAGIAARLLGAADAELAAALSLAFAEGIALHEHGSDRACATAASSAVRLALLARAGAPAMPRALSAHPDGFESRLLGGATIRLCDVPAGHAVTARDPLLVWHRFELAVRQRYSERHALRLLAAIHADAAFETQPLQSFVAQFVRPS